MLSNVVKPAAQQAPLTCAFFAFQEMIERRKEEQEQFLLEKERAEERKRREMAEQAQAAEELRRRQQAAMREQERIQREMEERELEEAKLLLGNKKIKDGEKFDRKKIMHVSAYKDFISGCCTAFLLF